MYPMAIKPKKRLTPNMNAEAADMAAEQVQMQPDKPAPIIPTTNMNIPRMNFGGPQNREPNIDPRNPPQRPKTVNPNDPKALGPRLPTNYSGGNVTAGAPVPGAVTTPTRALDMAIDPNVSKAITQDTRTTDTRTTDEMLEDAIAELLGSGPRATAEEEEQIRRQMESDVSAGQAGLNARIAAGGGGTSGALGAMSTDMRSRAALDASNAIQGVKQDARDEYLRKLQLGLSGKQSDRTLDMDEAQFEMYMNMINEIFGGGQSPDGSVQGSNTIGRIGGNPDTEEGRKTNENMNKALMYWRQNGSWENLPTGEPSSGTQVTDTPSGGYHVYIDSNGNLFKVAVGSN